jgi:sugar phosphate isomerase/epimerase
VNRDLARRMPYRRGMRPDQIALQLYTVRRLAAIDLTGTLRAVAAAGYHSVELAGLADVDAGELAHRLRDAGLTAIASHEGIDRLRADPVAVAERLGRLGCPRAVVPWMPPEDRRTVDDVRRFVADLGRLVPVLADHGIRLGYHNHDFEFAPLDATTAWDVLLTEMPAGIELELDVYWLSVAGRDPVTEIRAAAGRVRLLHMKDRAPGPEPHDAPAGEGILPFPAIVDAARAASVEWYIAEQDDPHDALADIARAARYLESLTGERT